MRAVTLGVEQQDDDGFKRWVRDSLIEIEKASHDNVISDVAESGSQLSTLKNATPFQFPYYDVNSNAALGTMSAFTLTVLDDTDQAGWQATLGLTPGTNVQPHNANLDTLSAPGNWKVFYSDGSQVVQTLALGADKTIYASNGASVAPSMRTLAALGGLQIASNLSDVASPSTSRANLGVAYGLHSIWVPAGAMKARTTNGAVSANTETGTNKVNVTGLDFDQSTNQFAQFTVAMPKSWDLGTVTALFWWEQGAAGSGNVVWGLQAVATPTGTAVDSAFGTAQETTSAGGTSGDVYKSSETSAITIAGTLSADVVVWFQAYRNAASGSDTLAQTVRLIGVRIVYNTNANNDT